MYVNTQTQNQLGEPRSERRWWQDVLLTVTSIVIGTVVIETFIKK